MKSIALISLLALVLMGSTAASLAQQQKTCSLNIIGTWKAQISATDARLYTFDADGVVKVLEVSGTAKPREIATAKYELEDILDGAKTSKQISFTATGKNRIFGKTRATMDIVSFDDSSMTCSIAGASAPIRWTKVDPNRYFLVFVARQGEFYDESGSSFPMVIKTADGVSTVEAAGIYSKGGKPAFGAIPADVYKEYLREARGDSEVILRLEINSGQYERTLKVVQEWQRRAREGALLYDERNTFTASMPLNNVVLLKGVTETLNLCQNDLDLYLLDYEYPKDWITNQISPEFIPFVLFKELRRRNEARHIEYKKFQELVPLANFASR